MGHPVLGDRAVDGLRLHPAQTDMGARQRGDRPGKAPAVAVKHRQGPEIDRVRRDRLRHQVSERVEIGAAVVIDDALRIARRTRGVVERDRVPLVLRRPPVEPGIAGRDEVLVLDIADEVAAAGRRIVDIDHVGPSVETAQRIGHDRRGLPVGQQNPRFAVVENEGDGLGVEPDVDGVEHRAGHRHAEMGLEYRRHVGREDRHGVALADSPCRQRGSQGQAAALGLAPREAAFAVYHRDAIRIDRCGALEEAERRQRREVRGVLLESVVIRIPVSRGAIGHSRPPEEP